MNDLSNTLFTTLRPILVIPAIWLLYALLLIVKKNPKGKRQLKLCIGFCVIFGIMAAVAIAIFSQIPDMITSIIQ